MDLLIKSLALKRLRREDIIVKEKALIPIRAYDNMSIIRPVKKPIVSDSIKEEVKLKYIMKVSIKSGFIPPNMISCLKRLEV